MWRDIALKDELKRASGKGEITLVDKETLCYSCDGTERDSERISCRRYIVLD